MDALQYLTVDNIKKRVKELETREWKREISSKNTLAYYSEMKNNIKHEEEIYVNSTASKILYRARTNTPNLNWRKKFQGENTHCPLCNYE